MAGNEDSVGATGHAERDVDSPEGFWDVVEAAVMDLEEQGADQPGSYPATVEVEIDVR